MSPSFINSSDSPTTLPSLLLARFGLPTTLPSMGHTAHLAPHGRGRGESEMWVLAALRVEQLYKKKILQ
jgi:hypothetical protein